MPIIPFHKTHATIRAYDREAEEYAARWSGLLLSSEWEQFTSLLPAGGAALDLGCGPGRDVRELCQRGFRTCGLDRSRGMLQVARKAGENPYVRADMRRLPFAAGAFDGIWACASLLHLPRRELSASLAECRRVLRLPGILYLTMKEGEGSQWIIHPHGERVFLIYYRPDELVEQVQSVGFAIIDMRVSEDLGGRPIRWINLLARLSE